MTTPIAAVAILLSVVIIASDTFSRRVPNTWLLGAVVLGGVVMFTGWSQNTGGPLWPAFLGLLIGLISLLPFHVFGWMGAGDVKFFAVLGFLLGAKALLPIWIIGSLIAGMHAVLILLSRHGLMQTMPGWGVTQNWFTHSNLGQRLATARQGRQGLPYAAWLGVGALIVIFNPELMHW